MKARYSVQMMSRLLGVNARSYHNWVKRLPSAREVRRLRLTSKILEVYRESWGTYGSPRVHAELVDQGERVSRQLVEKLMREAGLRGVQKRKKGRSVHRSMRPVPSPDLVQRQFHAAQPNTLWVADMTYKRTGEGWAYIATIIDVYSRMCVGWAVSNRIDTNLALAALGMALGRGRSVTGCIHHSDQGSPYTSIRYQQALRHAGLTPSMGSTGDAYDNALAESMNSTLKADLLDEYRWDTRTKLTLTLLRYIEGFYNPKRRHSSLGHTSPLEYEQRLNLKDAV